jgi:hypothetical protein
LTPSKIFRGSPNHFLNLAFARACAGRRFAGGHFLSGRFFFKLKNFLFEIPSSSTPNFTADVFINLRAELCDGQAHRVSVLITFRGNDYVANDESIDSNDGCVPGAGYRRHYGERIKRRRDY